MPLFEFVCKNCQKRFTYLTGVVSGENEEIYCPQCASSDLKKLISRFTRGRSDDARMESMADKIETSDFDDPRQLRAFARQMGRQMGAETGEDLSDEMEAVMEAEDTNFHSQSNGSNGDDGTIY